MFFCTMQPLKKEQRQKKGCIRIEGLCNSHKVLLRVDNEDLHDWISYNGILFLCDEFKRMIVRKSRKTKIPGFSISKVI